MSGSSRPAWFMKLVPGLPGCYIEKPRLEKQQRVQGHFYLYNGVLKPAWDMNPCKRHTTCPHKTKATSSGETSQFQTKQGQRVTESINYTKSRRWSATPDCLKRPRPTCSVICEHHQEDSSEGDEAATEATEGEGISLASTSTVLQGGNQWMRETKNPEWTTIQCLPFCRVLLICVQGSVGGQTSAGKTLQAHTDS